MHSHALGSMQNWMEKRFEEQQRLVLEIFLNICWKLE